MAKLLLIGSFSGGNAGDTLVLASTIAAIDERIPGTHHYIVPTSDPAFVRGLDLHPRLTPVDIHVRRAKTFRFFGMPVLRELPRIDAIVSTAGIFFDHRLLDPRFNFISSLVPIFHAARWFGVPCFAVNVGITPPSGRIGAWVLRRSLRAQSHIAVRDADSLDLVSRLAPGTPVTHGADSVHMLLAEPPNTEQANVLGVNVAGYLGRYVRSAASSTRQKEEILDALSVQLERVGSKLNLKIAFFATARIDHVVHDELARRMQNSDTRSVELYDKDVKETISAFHGVRLFVGSRMHSCILSTGLRIPTVALAYHPKVRSYMSEIGQCDWVIDLAAEALGGGRLAGRVEAVESARDEIRTRLDIVARERAERAASSFTLLRTALS